MSKFKNILKAAKEREEDTEVATAQAPSADKVEEKALEQVESPSSKPSVAAPEQERSPSSSSEIYSQPSKRGRPKGKRSDPDYEQVTAYIKKETYRQTKIALLQQGEVQDFSLLVEQLLSEWLSTQNSKKPKS
jgi:hypothetical protein